MYIKLRRAGQDAGPVLTNLDAVEHIINKGNVGSYVQVTRHGRLQAINITKEGDFVFERIHYDFCTVFDGQPSKQGHARVSDSYCFECDRRPCMVNFGS